MRRDRIAVTSFSLNSSFNAAREIGSEQHRTKALSSLAPVLPPALLSEALAAARDIQHELFRAKALSSLVPVLPELLPEALAAARQIQDDYDRAEVLSSLAPVMPELLPEALATVVAAKGIYFGDHRKQALSSLADKLCQIPKTQLFSCWQDTLHTLSLYAGPVSFADIVALTPVIFTLGGTQAVKDTATAIQDVSRWWG